eukprot:359787-Chlamydomonas_euryale.AAC.5
MEAKASGGRSSRLAMGAREMKQGSPSSCANIRHNPTSGPFAHQDFVAGEGNPCGATVRRNRRQLPEDGGGGSGVEELTGEACVWQWGLTREVCARAVCVCGLERKPAYMPAYMPAYTCTCASMCACNVYSASEQRAMMKIARHARGCDRSIASAP